MKKLLLYFVCLLVIPVCSYARDQKAHMMAFIAMENVPIIFGGFGGKLTKTELLELHIIIDGNGGGKHRHNGSHNPNKVIKDKRVLLKGWNLKAVRNGVIIHNICDMADPGPDGTNNWEKTPKRHKHAIEMEKKILAGKRIFRFPTWAKRSGSEITILSKSKKLICKIYKNTVSFYDSNKLIKGVASKIKVLVDMTPTSVKKYGGPVIYVAYEGATYTYHIVKDGFDLETEIKNAISIAAGVASSYAGAKVGAIVCAPLEAIPVGGVVAHIGGTLLISVGSGIAGEYIASKGIEFVEVNYLK